MKYLLLILMLCLSGCTQLQDYVNQQVPDPVQGVPVIDPPVIDPPDQSPRTGDGLTQENGYNHSKASGVWHENQGRTHCYWKGARSGPGKLYFDGELVLDIPDMSKRYPNVPPGATPANSGQWKPMSDWYGGPAGLSKANTKHDSCCIEY